MDGTGGASEDFPVLNAFRKDAKDVFLANADEVVGTDD
jgi:hypothetical protein